MNADLKYISFSSPKGGVGRTLTLCNCARIYAAGSEWAQIDPCITLLADLDFNAPGLHYYDFSRLSSAAESHYVLASEPDRPLSRPQMLEELNVQRIGLLFLLSAILADTRFIKAIADGKVRLATENIPAAETYAELNNSFRSLLRTPELNPLRHLIAIHHSGGSFYIFPAASPNHPEFNEYAIAFNWFELIGEAFGLLLLDCIFLETVNHIKKEKGLTAPVRILLDQQAGVSIPSTVNRTLAHASVYVSGMNAQNKTGLESLARDYFSKHKKNPWIILNQYNFRKLALDYSFDTGALTPHELFRKHDKLERLDLIEKLVANNPGLRDRIFVTEFLSDAIQREHFYTDHDPAINELTRMLVSIERTFREPPPLPAIKTATDQVIFVGERISSNPAWHKGPLTGIYKLLEEYYGLSTSIVVIAAQHDEIVALMRGEKVGGRLQHAVTGIQSHTLNKLESGLYFFIPGKGRLVLSLPEIDFIAWPYYLSGDIKGLGRIRRLHAAEFEKPQQTPDAYNATSLPYYRNNILRWSEYAEKEDGFIEGVPLFVDIQLMAYRKDLIFDKDKFGRDYRKWFRRDFEGFKAPQDLLDFAWLAKRTTLADNTLLLCGNPRNISMWYEWQTIFSIFYNVAGQPPENYSIEEYCRFLLREESLDATLLYLELLKSADLTEKLKHYNWDQIQNDFFLKGNNGVIFVWPDTIPVKNVTDAEGSDSFIYQVPPSFHHFEECWLMSVTEQPDLFPENFEKKLGFMNYFLTLPAQYTFAREGGLPLHKAVLSSLDIWYDYPFIPPIWQVYLGSHSTGKLVKRDSFAKNFNAGKAIAAALYRLHADNNFDASHPNAKDALRTSIRESLQQLITPLTSTSR